MEVNGTLIIQPGATINIGLIGDGIDVYGTVVAEGTSANPVQINGSVQGHIFFAAYSAVWFYPSSTSWNQQTNYGSLIENTIFNNTGLEVQSAIRISDNKFLSGGLTVESASPTIINNDIPAGLSIIQNPNIQYNATATQPEIFNNTVEGGLYVDAGSGIVADNVITGLNVNDAYSGPVSTLIVRNLIKGAGIGVSCNIQSFNNNKVTIENNTVTNNSAGVQLGSANVPAIINNNIYGNSYNAKLSGVSSQISLPNNWWGTTDVQAINQTMYDFKYDFTLGTINFLPILATPNPQALPNPAAETTTPIPTSSPTPSPTSTSTPTQVPTPTPATTQAPTPTPLQTANSTPTSTTIPTSTPSSTQSPTSTPAVSELSWLAIVPLLLSVFSIAVLVRHRKTSQRFTTI